MAVLKSSWLNQVKNEHLKKFSLNIFLLRIKENLEMKYFSLIAFWTHMYLKVQYIILNFEIHMCSKSNMYLKVQYTIFNFEIHMCSKSNETEAVFTKIETNKEWNHNFFKIILLAFRTLVPVSFPWFEAPLKFFFVLSYFF